MNPQSAIRNPRSKRRLLINLIVGTWLVPAAVPAQPVPAPPLPPSADTVDADAPADLAEALDRALIQIRIAEERDPVRSQDAFGQLNTLLTWALEREPGNLRARFYQARAYVLGGREAEAISRFQDWIRSREGQNDWEGHYILAQVYFDMEFFKLAKPLLEDAIVLNPREPRPYLLLSKCEAKLLNRQGAIARVRQAIQMLGDNVDPDTYILLAEAFLLNKQYADALDAARRSKELALFKVRESGGDYSALTKANECIQVALKVTQTALEANPDNAVMYLSMSQLLQQQAQMSTLTTLHAALSWSLQGIQRAGDRPSEAGLLDVAQLLLRVGRAADAARVINNTLELYPDSTRAQQLRDRLPAQTPAPPEP